MDKQDKKHGLVDLYWPVLDKGFCALKEYMGSDESIERAARVSYGKGTRGKSDTRNLIRYLMKHGHTSPFEMAEVQFHISIPIFVMRQFIRHRTANVNEYSARYSEVPEIWHEPEKSRYTKQSTNNKQGSSDEEIFDNNIQFHNFRYEANWRNSKQFEEYQRLLQSGCARELARIDLPLSTYTYFYWKCDLHNLFHMLRLRLDEHAQYEIRVLAGVIAGIVKELYPLSWEAFEDYKLNSVNFTQKEITLLNEMIHTNDMDDHELEGMDDWLSLSKREQGEFKAKLQPKQYKSYDLDLTLAKPYSFFEQGET